MPTTWPRLKSSRRRRRPIDGRRRDTVTSDPPGDSSRGGFSSPCAAGGSHRPRSSVTLLHDNGDGPGGCRRYGRPGPAGSTAWLAPTPRAAWRRSTYETTDYDDAVGWRPRRLSQSGAGRCAGETGEMLARGYRVMRQRFRGSGSPHGRDPGILLRDSRCHLLGVRLGRGITTTHTADRAAAGSAALPAGSGP